MLIKVDFKLNIYYYLYPAGLFNINSYIYIITSI